MLTFVVVASAISFGGLQGTGLIANPSFRPAGGGLAAGWTTYESGYRLDTRGRTDNACIVCTAPTASERHGAFVVLELNQSVAQPVAVTGWSRAQSVAGAADSDYSIYLDATYTDGDHLWGTTAAFDTGTHDWQRRTVLLTPAKPVKELLVYALFRNHTGTAWFDDFQARELTGGAIFDSQVIPAPKLARGRRSAWFVRDVAAGSKLVPAEAAGSLGLTATVQRQSDGVERLTVRKRKGDDRDVTIYYCERFTDPKLRWWRNLRHSALIGDDEAETVTATRAGAVGAMSLYPFACVTGATKGRMIAIPPTLGPRIARLLYHPRGGLLVAAFDVCLTKTNLANSGSATAEVFSAPCDPTWGFRDAADRYYRRFPRAFARRATADGIWMPFTDPSTVAGVRDFGIAYHEGDNSVAGDAKLGILSFRYTEPMTWWMPMAPALPRTYASALEVLQQNLTGPNEENRRWAQAVENSVSRARDGRFNVEFQNQPWANGAVWILNPNPHLPLPAGQWNKARLSYTKEAADERLGPGRLLSGEYLDSTEGWADYLDYGATAIAHSQVPVTFGVDDGRPVVPQWFSTYELMAFMSRDLHARGRLLMANSTPWRLWAFLPLLDVSGTETNWNPDGRWAPDGDDIFLLRRTLSYHKPYLLLQNTDFSRFTPEMVGRYFARSMAYGVFPSMFSANAATQVYWENPALYNRDRPTFQHFIAMIKRLSAAGWEPLTFATSSEPDVHLERFGRRFLTVFDDSPSAWSTVISVDARRLHLGAVRLRDAFTGRLLSHGATAKVRIKPEECLVIEIE